MRWQGIKKEPDGGIPVSITEGSEVIAAVSNGSLLMDDDTGGLVIMSEFHEQIHRGIAYEAAIQITGATDFRFTKGSVDTECHVVITIVSDNDDIVWQLHEGDGANNGTSLPVYNRKPSSTTDNEWTIKYGSFTEGAAIGAPHYVYGSNQSRGNASGRGFEYALYPPDSDVIVRVSSGTCEVSFVWYEPNGHL